MDCPLTEVDKLFEQRFRLAPVWKEVYMHAVGIKTDGGYGLSLIHIWMEPWTTVRKAQNQQIVLLKQSEGLRPLRHLLDSFLVNGTARMPRSRALSPEACALEHFQLSLLKQ